MTRIIGNLIEYVYERYKMAYKISQHRLDAIKKDIERLNRINTSSFETGIAMTTDMVKLVVTQIREENPTLSDQDLLEKARKMVYLGRM